MIREVQEDLYIKQKEQIKRNCQSDFWVFCLYMDKDFFLERKEVLKPIARALQRLVKPRPPETELDILNVSVPPRTGKSYLVTLFVSWCFGNIPGASIMRNTVTAKLYNKFSSDTKDIITGQTHDKKYSQIFPDITLETTANEGWKLTSHTQGISYFGAGVEGSIIGFGATLLDILDDSIKDEFMATNKNSLDKVWSWVTSAADSREEKGCKKCFVGTRWSQLDPVGRMTDAGEFDGPNALNISIPALINGKSYCEAIHTTESLLRKKKLLSTFIWEAEWMQNPISSAGLLFPADSLNWYKSLPAVESDGRICKVDVADKGSDFLSAPVGDLRGPDTYIVDVVFTQDGVGSTIPRVAKLCFDHNLDNMDIESNNGGSMYAIMVREAVEDLVSQGHFCQTYITDTFQSKNKETRILMSEGYIKEHFWFPDRSTIEEGSDMDAFIRNVITYTKSGKNDHDDGPDSLEGLKRMISDYDPGRFEISG